MVHVLLLYRYIVGQRSCATLLCRSPTSEIGRARRRSDKAQDDAQVPGEMNLTLSTVVGDVSGLPTAP